MPLMLLDDVMSELDADRRELLAAELSAGGQSVIATTDLAHVPGAGDAHVDAPADRRRHGSAGGACGMSRPAPRSLVKRARTARPRRSRRRPRWRECRRAWEGATGPAIAAAARPTAERDGVVTVLCEASVWAHELELMSAQLVEQLNAALGEQAIRELRCRTG